MKKLVYSLFASALLIIGANNVSAVENIKESNEKVEIPSSFKKVQPKANTKNLDMFSSYGQRAISVNMDINGVYRLGSDRVPVTRDTLSNGDIELSVRDSGYEFISVYRNTSYGYAHISNEYKNNNQRLSVKYYFHYIVKGQNNNAKRSFQSGYLTNGYKIKTVDYKGFNNYYLTDMNKRAVHTYNANADFDYHYTSATEYGMVNNKLVKKVRIDAPRYANSRQVKNVKRSYYYPNGKAKNYTNYRLLDYTVNPSRFTYKAYDNANYNGRGQLTSLKNVTNYKIYKNGKWKINSVILSGTYRTYYGNGRLKTNQVSKKSKYNNFTSIKKTTYRSNGKKYSYINRSYKSGKAKYHTLYRYNSKGNTKGSGAYKVNVYFNKRGKATSAKKATYKRNGKLNKAKKIKVRSSLYKI